MKSIVFFITICISTIGNAGEVSFGSLRLQIPDGWTINGSVINSNENKKIGELVSKRDWPYETGQDFVESFKNGFIDDDIHTKFISSGSEDNIYWVCRKGMWEDGEGKVGFWYTRTFWVSGPIFTLYSHKSCEENFNNALSIAKTLKEK